MADATQSENDGRRVDGANPSAHDASAQGDAHATDTVAHPTVSGSTTDTTAHFREDFEAQLASLSSEVSPEELEAVGALPSGSALLIVRRGPNVGARFLLDSDVTTAGRHPEADIFLDDVTVSRRHSEFLRSGTSFEMRDLGSLNGTYFDGVRVDAAVLADGSEVQIGKFRLTFYASRLDLAARSAN
jgi:pSer/pThr/pTyr-binding forkhead associated (FHA) protein